MTLCPRCGLPILHPEAAHTDHTDNCPNRIDHDDYQDCDCRDVHPWCCTTCHPTLETS